MRYFGFNSNGKVTAVAVLTTLLFTACSNDEREEWTDNGNKALPIMITSEVLSADAGDTRAATNLQATQIASGVKVGVFIYDALNFNSTSAAQTYASSYKKENVEYTANGSGGWSATPGTYYFPMTGNKVNIYAYAPKKSSWNLTSANSHSVNTDQTTAANYNNSDLLSGVASNSVAPTSNAVPIQFSHVLSKVTVVLVAGNGVSLSDVSKVEILNTKVAGTVTMESNVIKSVAPASGATVSTIQCGGAGSGTSYSCSAIVIPGQSVATTTEFIRITMNSGGTYSYKPQTAVNLTANKEYKYTITLNTYGLTVTSSITNWTSGVNETGSTKNNQ